MWKPLIALSLMMGSASAECLTPTVVRATVPVAEETYYPFITDLVGPIYYRFSVWMEDAEQVFPSHADEAIVFHAPQKGHGADVRVVFFKDGCAIGKASYPAILWMAFAEIGKEA